LQCFFSGWRISLLIAESNLINARIADRLYALEDAKIMKALRG
jgi:hypothetical protein